MIVRPERREDIPAIHAINTRAFGGPDEANLVDALRTAGDLALSLVAEGEAKLVAHIAFSPITAPFRALSLAPVGVFPEYQRQGYGRALIEHGLNEARAQGWDAVFVLGDVNYYRRFGFDADLARDFKTAYSGPHFMVLPLAGRLPISHGQLTYAPAFAALG